MLLTRVPVPWTRLSDHPPDLKRSLWAYPVIGAVVSGLGALAWLGALALSLPPLFAALFAVAVMVLVTGAFHEDGLADTADGFGGGLTRERKLEIMRDSRIGTYGTLAVVLSVLLRAAALAGLAGPQGVVALLVSGGVSRGAIVATLAVLPPARPDGIGRSAGRPSTFTLAVVAATCAGLAALTGSLAAICLVAIAAAVVVVVLVVLSRRQIGGYSGDVLGAVQQLCELAVIVVLAAYWTAT